MDEAETLERVMLMAQDEPTEIAQPGEQAFDFPPSAVASATARLLPEHGTSISPRRHARHV